MPHEAPSKTELLERRAERDLMHEGKSILEERRDMLAHLVLDQMRLTQKLTGDCERLFKQAREQVRRAAMRHGLTGLERFAGNQTQLLDVTWSIRNRLGTAWLEQLASGNATTRREMGVGHEISLELELAVNRCQLLLQYLLVLATAENNLVRLVGMLRRTQRRVNALDHVLLPEIHQTIQQMEDAMDEMERDDLIRSLLIKRKKSR